MDGLAVDVVAGQLDLAGVQTGPDLQAQRPEGFRNGEGTADTSGGSVEEGQEPRGGRKP